MTEEEEYYRLERLCEKLMEYPDEEFCKMAFKVFVDHLQDSYMLSEWWDTVEEQFSTLSPEELGRLWIKSPVETFSSGKGKGVLVLLWDIATNVVVERAKQIIEEIKEV